MGRPLVPAGRLLPHRPLPLGLRGRLLRPVPRGQLRRPNIDIYDAEAPVGFEIERQEGARRAQGRLRPAAVVGRQPGRHAQVHAARFGDYRRDRHVPGATSPQQSALTSSSAIPHAAARARPRCSLSDAAAARSASRSAPSGPGSTKVGDTFQIAGEVATAATGVLRGRSSDHRRRHLRRQGQGHGRDRAAGTGTAQGAYMGLVADGGPTANHTFTGWTSRTPARATRRTSSPASPTTSASSRSARTSCGRSRSSGRCPANVPSPGRAAQRARRSVRGARQPRDHRRRAADRLRPDARPPGCGPGTTTCARTATWPPASTSSTGTSRPPPTPARSSRRAAWSASPSPSGATRPTCGT